MDEEEEREGIGMSVQLGKSGYLVELKKKDGFFKEYGELQKVLMSGQKLSEILARPNYYVITAASVNMTEYQLNHADEKLEEWD